MNRKLLAGIGAVVLLFAAAYLGSPWLAVREFRSAAVAADADRLDAAVDFPAVRDSLKSQFSAALMRKMTSDPQVKDNPFAALGMMMMPALIDKMVDAFVTPEGISALARGQKPAAPGARPSPTPKADPDAVAFDGQYVNLDRFRVRTTDTRTHKPGPSLLFERRGLFSWKLIRIELPESLFDEMKPAPPAATRR